MAESIIVFPKILSGKTGEVIQLNTKIYPENTSNRTFKWWSSNDKVARVNNSGLVMVMSEGNCIITVETTDGSNLKDECIFTSGSGIDSVLDSKIQNFDIYDDKGLLIKKNCDKNFIKGLSAGLYVIINGGRVQKIFLY